MTDKVKCYAVVALICAWPLINFSIHNAALISGSKEVIGAISVVFISVVLFAFTLLYILIKLFGNENQTRYALAGSWSAPIDWSSLNVSA